jgi:hypothetical protein
MARLHGNLISLFTATVALAFAPAAHSSAALDGLWCGTGLLHEFSLKLRQLGSAQVEGTLMRRNAARDIKGYLDGKVLHTQTTRYGSLMLEAAGNELRVTGGDGMLFMARGTAFKRAGGEACLS